MFKNIILISYSIFSFATAKDIFNQENNSDIFNQENNSALIKNTAKISEESTEKIGLKFDDIAIKELFKIVGQHFNKSFIVSGNITESIQISLDETNLDKALELIAFSANLSYENKNGVYIIKKINDTGCNFNGVIYPINSIIEMKKSFYTCKEKEIKSNNLFSHTKKDMRWEKQ